MYLQHMLLKIRKKTFWKCIFGQYTKKWSILVNKNLSGQLKILKDIFVVD